MVSAAEYRDAVAREMSEAALQARVLELAAALGWRWYHTRDSRRSPAGFPDLVMVHRRRRLVLFVELKRERGRVTKEQTEWLGDLRAADAHAVIWRPVDWLNGHIEQVLRGAL